MSENIKVVSIIGRFLEHSRIFWFENDGKPETYIGSADWMRRNLDRRVEAITPIQEPNLLKQIEQLLEMFVLKLSHHDLLDSPKGVDFPKTMYRIQCLSNFFQALSHNG